MSIYDLVLPSCGQNYNRIGDTVCRLNQMLFLGSLTINLNFLLNYISD